MPDPRPTDPVDEMELTMYIEHVAYLIDQDKDDLSVADDLRVLDGLLSRNPPLYCAVFDKLAELKIITKAHFRAWVNLRDPRDN